MFLLLNLKQYQVKLLASRKKVSRTCSQSSLFTISEAASPHYNDSRQNTHKSWIINIKVNKSKKIKAERCYQDAWKSTTQPTNIKTNKYCKHKTVITKQQVEPLNSRIYNELHLFSKNSPQEINPTINNNSTYSTSLKLRKPVSKRQSPKQIVKQPQNILPNLPR